MTVLSHAATPKHCWPCSQRSGTLTRCSADRKLGHFQTEADEVRTTLEDFVTSVFICVFAVHLSIPFQRYPPCRDPPSHSPFTTHHHHTRTTTPPHQHTSTLAHQHTSTPAHQHTSTPAHQHTSTPAHHTAPHRTAPHRSAPHHHHHHHHQTSALNRDLSCVASP